ncbi:MAG: hypothetical protein ABIB71_02290 [Candidatus Woesearchaeota archaeon]
MEETITEGQKKNILQLKKLLGSAKKQDLGDVEKWKQVPVEYIISAKTFGVELNDYALKRLSKAEDKEDALYSIMIAQHFGKAAERSGKKDLAERLKKMVEDESMKTEDIAFYATKAIENELPKDKVLEKLAKAYSVDKRKVKEGLENTLDIVLVPTDENNVYVHMGNVPKSLENLTLNVYSKNEKKEDLEKSVLEAAISSLKKRNEERIKGEKKGLFALGITTLLFPAVGSVVLTGIPAALARGDNASLAMLIVGGAGFCAMGGFSGYLIYDSYKNIKKALKKKDSLEKDLPGVKLNWIKDKGLEAIYDSTIAGKEAEEKKFENPIVKEALEWTIIDSTDIGVKGTFLDAYKRQLKLLEGEKKHELKINVKG